MDLRDFSRFFFFRKADMGEDTDDFNELNNQLISLGLVLKPIPGKAKRPSNNQLRSLYSSLLNSLTWYSWCTLYTLTKVLVKLGFVITAYFEVHGSFWHKRIQQGMIQQEVLTVGHPNLCLSHNSKSLFLILSFLCVFFMKN